MMQKGDRAPRISVIVPVYRVEKYLERCVKAASGAHTAGDIQTIAAGYGQTLSDEQAELLLYMYSEEVPLPPEFLDTVSGGACRAVASAC